MQSEEVVGMHQTNSRGPWQHITSPRHQCATDSCLFRALSHPLHLNPSLLPSFSLSLYPPILPLPLSLCLAQSDLAQDMYSGELSGVKTIGSQPRCSKNNKETKPHPATVVILYSTICQVMWCIHCLWKVFRSLDFFHILLRCSLILKCIKIKHKSY